MFRERKNRTHKSLAKIKLVRNTLNGTCSMFVFKLSFFATSKLFQKWYAKYQFMFALYSCCWVWICVCAENEIQFLRPISEFNWLNSVFGLTYNSSPDHNLCYALHFATKKWWEFEWIWNKRIFLSLLFLRNYLKFRTFFDFSLEIDHRYDLKLNYMIPMVVIQRSGPGKPFFFSQNGLRGRNIPSFCFCMFLEI